MLQLVAVGVVTAVLMLAAGALGLFMMIIGLNGFSESEATPMLVAYIALALLSVVVAAAASGWGARALASATRWSMWAAAPLTVALVCVAGIVVLAVGWFVIILVGSSVR
ncbi:MAG TPA: hypothetical protein VFX96_09705 [Pyrinomonadaceae bacterium]|nr:hypothetical protein [Pyrinomonadaceae bacterium]